MFLLDSTFWEVRKTKRKGRGVFAKKELSGGIVIGDYLGIVIDPKDDTSDTDGMYNMWVNNNTSLVYASPKEIGIHLLNHSCEPNCAIFPYQSHVLFFTLRKIFPNEELTIDYMIDSPTDPISLIHICRCGSPLCRGTMHTTDQKSIHWGMFQQTQFDKYNKIVHFKYGEELKKLHSYPQHIPDDTVYDLMGSRKRAPFVYVGSMFPEVQCIRELIRNTGKQLNVKSQHIIIEGIINQKIIVCPNTKKPQQN